MRCLFAAALTLSAGAAAAQGTPQASASHAIVVSPDQVTWQAAPPVLPAGAKLAVLEGNPSEAGPFTMRVLMPDRYRIPPHFHPVIEHVTVLKGTFKVGMGDKFDRSALAALPAGTFAALEPGTRHFAEAEGETRDPGGDGSIPPGTRAGTPAEGPVGARLRCRSSHQNAR